MSAIRATSVNQSQIICNIFVVMNDFFSCGRLWVSRTISILRPSLKFVVHFLTVVNKGPALHPTYYFAIVSVDDRPLTNIFYMVFHGAFRRLIT